MAAALPGRPAPRHASSPALPEQAAEDFLGRLKRPCRLLVAYSGGGDSTGLLVALADALQRDPDGGITLVAATVDHGLRPGSAEEARTAGTLCRALSIPHHILAWQGDKPVTGIQAAAREARYRLLGVLARDLGADLIVTAHTLDDQAETIAMRQARNPEAAGGISEAVLYDRHVWIFRSFLGVRRSAIRSFLAGRGIGWVDDPSNDNMLFERVRIRKSLGEATVALPTEAGAMQAVAERLRAGARIHAGRVAIADLSSGAFGDDAGLAAILQLAAMVGGRTYPGGREAAARIGRFLRSAEEPRLNAGRVVFDRRKQLLFLTRERRSLPEVTIAPGAIEIWDSRFRIFNGGDRPARVGARGAGLSGAAILPGALPEMLPGAVRQRILATEPILAEGSPRALRAEPVIAQFDRFLPLRMLEVANVLAFLAGLDHFPRLPTR